MVLRVFLLFFGLSICSCAQLQYIDRGRLNHPAMDLNKSASPETKNYLTTMDVGNKGAGGETCTVCAK